MDNRSYDDVINVSGHRMGTAEIESALVLHESVVEAAVVGYPRKMIFPRKTLKARNFSNRYRTVDPL